MDALSVLESRGFVKQCTNADRVRAALNTGRVTFYVGFDPTADSLHVGHLLPIMAMANLQRLGHRAIAVVGGGTARVGDPTGKTEMRQMLSDDVLASNVAALRGQLAHFLVLDGEQGLLVDNADWLMELQYIPFLRDIGRLFSVNRMLAAEAYKQRLERGLSFIEFNYQILQAYDFLELHRRHGCTLQLGGDDQWGNIVAGTDLIRRCEATESDGLTMPLILTAAGQKMGKTAKGAVWLSADRLAPFDYFQYWLNVDDRDVGRFLKLYTFLPLDRIAELEAMTGKHARVAKRVLAMEATTLAHGAAAAEAADRAAKAMVKGAAAAQLPTHTLAAEERIVVILNAAGLAKSVGEARRLVRGGGVRLDNQKVASEDATLAPDALGDGVVLRVGKKRAVRVVAGST